MPCYEPDYIYSKGDAVLCSIFHREEEIYGTIGTILDNLDYNLIGLSRKQVEEWWEDHKKLDKQKLKEKS